MIGKSMRHSFAKRGAVTGCKPPCEAARKVRPGARGMQMPSA